MDETLVPGTGSSQDRINHEASEGRQARGEMSELKAGGKEARRQGVQGHQRHSQSQGLTCHKLADLVAQLRLVAVQGRQQRPYTAPGPPAVSGVIGAR